MHARPQAAGIAVMNPLLLAPFLQERDLGEGITAANNVTCRIL
jgi:hypothetical protein